MSTGALTQFVYVVRLWPAGLQEPRVWRVTAQNPATGERHIFATLEEFFAFIDDSTRAAFITEAATDQSDSAENAV